MRRPVLCVALLAAVLLAPGCADAPTQDECGALVEHLIKLDSARSEQPLTAEQERSMRGSLDGQATADCLANMTGTKVRCALEAESIGAAKSCDDR